MMIFQILVSKGHILKKIKEVVGEDRGDRAFVAVKYQDEDGDEVTANTEEEATMVVFEESITRLKVDLTYYYCSNLQLEDDRVL